MSSIFKTYVCVFPGKGALSWKLASDYEFTKEEAELESQKYCNSTAIPIQLYRHIKDCEYRMVVAETAYRAYRNKYGELTNV
jgi:hypothetical protein